MLKITPRHIPLEGSLCPIQKLSDELMLNIFGYLNPSEASQARAVCWNWNILLVDNHLWKLFLHRDFPLCNQTIEIEKSLGNYKNCCVLRSNLAKGVYTQHTLKGHKGDVCAIHYHKGLLFSSSYDSTIKIWDLRTMTCSHTLEGHRDGVTSFVVDDERLYSASYDGTIKVWDLRTNTCTLTLEGHRHEVNSLISVEGVLFSGSRDNTIRSWSDINPDVRPTTLVEHNGISRPIIHAHGMLISGSFERKLKIWDVQTGTCLHTLEGNPSLAISFLCKDKQLIVGYWDGQIEIWNLETQTLLHTFKGHEGTIRSLAFADGFFISASSDNTIKFWKGPGECLHSIECNENRTAFSLDYVDGLLFVGYVNHEIDIFDFNPNAAKNPQ